MPDQFGHAAQLPQIFRSFGIDGAVLWRGVGPERPPHAFRWIGPDGSEVTALWLQDGYGSGRRLPSDPQGFADAVERTLERLGDWIGEMPILFPVGDDHVRLATWLPECAAALRSEQPDVEVRIGGYHDHLPQMGTPTHIVRGEMRSPAFSPVLAGVASARIREKQARVRRDDAAVALRRAAHDDGAAGRRHRLGGGRAGARARGSSCSTTRRTTPPPAAASTRRTRTSRRAIAGPSSSPARRAIRRWRSCASTCRPARRRTRSRSTPGRAQPAVIVETMVPVALLDGDVASRGPDGVLRPIQLLGGGDESPDLRGRVPRRRAGAVSRRRRSEHAAVRQVPAGHHGDRDLAGHGAPRRRPRRCAGARPSRSSTISGASSRC